MGPGGTSEKKNNVLPLWGSEKTMNLNNLILTNILSSHYFKVNLYQLKTYHEVVDEIYYNVSHLEPWEKGSRKTSGQTGMCGGVRGVGAGGIVSTAFCILYKLFTLKLTRKQLIGLLTHRDSPYIRGLGFMYIRYTQPPADLWEWFEPYLDDEEEMDVKAGGGQVMSIGEILRHLLSKLEWFSTLFPRIPVPIQKDLERKLSTLQPLTKSGQALEEQEEAYEENEEETTTEVDYRKREEAPWTGSASSRRSRDQEEPLRHRSGERVDRRDSRERHRRSRSPSHSRHHRHHRSRSRTKSNSERDRSGSRDRRHHHDRDRHHDRHHSHRSRRHSPSRHHHRSHH